MESEGKRKRPAAGGRDGWGREGKRREKMGRGERGGGEEAAPSGELAMEDEVEEFFAILRRMQAAARQFSGVGAAPRGRIPPAGARQPAAEEEKRSLRRWLPAFEWEDFEEEGDRKINGGGISGEMSSATSAPTTARFEEEENGGEEEEKREAHRGISLFLDLNADPE